MGQIGKIRNYNETTGTGFIAPEKGGEPLPFSRSDFRHEKQIPSEQDRYSYDTRNDEAGEICATNLQKT